MLNRILVVAVVFALACASTVKQSKQPESSDKAQGLVPLSRPMRESDTLLDVPFEYWPEIGLLRMKTEDNGKWETLDIEIRTGRRIRMVSDNPDAERGNIIPGPFNWETKVMEVCPTKDVVKSKKYRTGLFLVSEKSCDDVLGFDEMM